MLNLRSNQKEFKNVKGGYIVFGFQTPKGFIYAIFFVVRMVEGNGTTVPNVLRRQSFG